MYMKWNSIVFLCYLVVILSYVLLVRGLSVDLSMDIYRMALTEISLQWKTLCKGERSQFASCSTGELAQLLFAFTVSRTLKKKCEQVIVWFRSVSGTGDI